MSVVPLLPDTLMSCQPKLRGRPRVLSDQQRLVHGRASKRAWAAKHSEYMRVQIAALASRPEYLERRRQRYQAQQRAWLEAGGVPGHRGRRRAEPSGDWARSHLVDRPKILSLSK